MNSAQVKFVNLYRPIPLLALLLFWELATRRDPSLTFFFGSPNKIGAYLFTRTIDGSLPRDFAVTFVEATLGFILGNVVGTIVGLGLWYSKLALAIAKPYVIALGSAPHRVSQLRGPVLNTKDPDRRSYRRHSKL